LLVLDVETGEERWNFVAEEAGMVRGTPTVAGGHVYIPTTLGFVYSLSTGDGSVEWRFDTERDISATSTAVVDGEVILGTDDGGLLAIDAETGERTRSLPDLSGGGHLATPTIADGVVYALDSGGELHAIDLDTEEELWSVGTLSIGSSPVIIGGLIVIGDEWGFLSAYG
jgi:outer membrane protein assembly factor BamB